MATVGDSLEAHEIAFALVTESRLRMRVAGGAMSCSRLDDIDGRGLCVRPSECCTMRAATAG